MVRNVGTFRPPSVPARRNAAPQLFLGADSIGNAHARATAPRFRSDTACTRKPSGSSSAEAYRFWRLSPFRLTRHNAPPYESHSSRTDPPSAGMSMAISPSGVGYTSNLRVEKRRVSLKTRSALVMETSEGGGKPSSTASARASRRSASMSKSASSAEGSARGDIAAPPVKRAVGFCSTCIVAAIA